MHVMILVLMVREQRGGEQKTSKNPIRNVPSARGSFVGQIYCGTLSPPSDTPPEPRILAPLEPLQQCQNPGFRRRVTWRRQSTTIVKTTVSASCKALLYFVGQFRCVLCTLSPLPTGPTSKNTKKSITFQRGHALSAGIVPQHSFARNFVHGTIPIRKVRR